MDARLTTIGAEILYQSPTLVGVNSKSSPPHINAECPRCILETKDLKPEKTSEKSSSQSERSPGASTDSRHGPISKGKSEKGQSKSVEVRCPACSEENVGCNFWKNYENVDKVPVKEKDVAQKGDGNSDNIQATANEIELKNYFPKKMALFTVFEGDKTSSDASNDAGRTKRLQNTDHQLVNKTVELQTEESNTDQSIDGSLDALIKNIFYKLLESRSGKQTFSKTEYDDFINRNRDRCKSVVERMIEDLVLSDSGDSSEILTKEQEVATYNYSTRVNRIVTDSEISYSTSATEINSLAENVKNKYEQNVLISTDIKLDKEAPISEECTIKDKNLTYADIVQDLLKKCFDQSTFSELSCKIESFESKERVSGNKSEIKNVKVSFSQPNSKIKVRLSKNIKSSDNSKVELKSSIQDDVCLDSATDERTTTNKHSLAKIANKKEDFKEDSTIIKSGSSTDKSSRSSVYNNITKTVQNVSTTDKKCFERRDSARCMDDVILIPVKTSRGTNQLRLEDSDVKTNEARGVMSKLCMFFCRRCRT